ncbi:MAG TPA: hypothetical protein PL110_16860 [Candidatus Eremiobacteraeota bacterium]|nr:MAG: hypothetical protein BWY64_02917 [bacterium ADurb.Bin363]HPZ09772.1 hypothetical protein [Candidatus Eremiobacteraeota bacterium]
MKIILKKFKDTPKGRIVEKKETAIIEFDGMNTRVKTIDWKLKGTLEEIFSVPFTVRKPVIKDGLRAFILEMVKPDTPEYFREISYLLRKIGYYTKLIE